MTAPDIVGQLAVAMRSRLLGVDHRRDAAGDLWQAALEAETGFRAKRQPAPDHGRAAPIDLLHLLQPEPIIEPSSPGIRSGNMILPASLGPNARHADALNAAAARTGVPAAAIAAIIDAEAAKAHDGRWNSASRNPRSSAAGLGQFLKATWVGEAESRGSWLNARAGASGWLDGVGRVRPESREALLALRFDSEASIQATADFARGNLDRLRRSGIAIGAGAEEQARLAYLSHQLGAGDAVRFLRGGLSDRRAGHLLAAQVGTVSAAQRISASGDASGAHRRWLLAYVDQRIRPDRYLA